MNVPIQTLALMFPFLSGETTGCGHRIKNHWILSLTGAKVVRDRIEGGSSGQGGGLASQPDPAPHLCQWSGW